MAQAMKRLGVYLGLVEDDPHYAQQASQGRLSTAGVNPGGSATPSTHERSTASVATLDRPKGGHETRARRSEPPVPQPAVDPYSIHTIHPRSYNDARRIGEEYRAGAPVIMNLTDMDDSDAKRIIDFGAGLVFAMHGTMEKITAKVFLLSPANVDVRDAPAVQQARDGFFNQS